MPGPMSAVTSQGTHHLLKQGARLVTSVDDILEELRLRAQPVPESALAAEVAAPQHPLGDAEQRVLACVGEGTPQYIDAIASQAGMALPDVSSALLQLELKRVVQQLPGKQFIKTSLKAQGCRL